MHKQMTHALVDKQARVEAARVIRYTLVCMIVGAMIGLASPGQTQPADAPNLTVKLIGGPFFSLPQATPKSPDFIDFPPSLDPPLVIRAILTNEGTEDFVGIPSSTLFSTMAGAPFLLSGTVGTEDGQFVFEGDGLRDVPASPPFLGGFVLKPGESRLFILHIIYGMLCNGCIFPPTTPVLEPAPCGTTVTITGSTLDIKMAELDATGTVVANPSVPPEIREQVGGPYPLTVSVACEIAVNIDIKPGSFPNSINPRSRGRIPVAILTTDTFDATTVDPTRVRFGRTGTETAPVHSALEDVDGDGDTDMILHFNTQATGIQCGDTSASLTGETFSGEVIDGSDSINTVGCK